MSLHSVTLSWFWPNKSLILLFNAASLAVKQQIYILSVYGLTHLRFAPTIALVVSMLTITLSTDMVQMNLLLQMNN